MYDVKLTYFKESGKYYSEGNYQTEKTDLFEIFREVRDKVERGRLPGLCDGAKFTTLIAVPGHPHEYPHLIIHRGT